jgi:hypothetical protein
MNETRNDGETLLAEGGGANRTENLGTVAAAGADTLSDPTNTFNLDPFGTGLPENYGIAIVAGTGAGQTRDVTSHEGDSLQVDHPWEVAPDATSHYATFVWGLERALIAGNTLTGNPRGIWLYQTAVRDVDIERNTIVEGGGIFLRTFQSLALKQFDSMYNVDIHDNQISNSQRNWMSYIDAVFVTKDLVPFGTADTGIAVRRNDLQANSPNVTSNTEDYARREGFLALAYAELASGQPSSGPMLLGTVFQANRCSACDTEFTVGAGDAGAVLFDDIHLPVPPGTRFLADLATLGSAVGASSGTEVVFTGR